jgi:class 3 adenylate cyclase
MSQVQELHSGRAAGETFLFADLCGFTEYTSEHGDELAADLAISFHRRVRELVSEEGCELIKCIGDAVMIHSGDCRVAMQLAHRILALGDCEGRPPIRIGMDRGPAVQREGDWYGGTVNVAARVADAATAGELLVTERACNAMRGAARVRLVARGVLHLKGLPALAVHSARSPEALGLRSADPRARATEATAAGTVDADAGRDRTRTRYQPAAVYRRRLQTSATKQRALASATS